MNLEFMFASPRWMKSLSSLEGNRRLSPFGYVIAPHLPPGLQGVSRATSWRSAARRSGSTGRLARLDAESRTRAAEAPGTALRAREGYMSSRYAAISGKTMVASDSITKRGVSTASLPQVIFSPGGAPLYEP